LIKLLWMFWEVPKFWWSFSLLTIYL